MPTERNVDEGAARQDDRGTGHPNLFIERDYAEESRATRWAIRIETRVEIVEEDPNQSNKEFDKVISMLRDKKLKELADYFLPRMPQTTGANKRARRLVAGALGSVDPHPTPEENP